jgi:hypothetical protein
MMSMNNDAVMPVCNLCGKVIKDMHAAGTDEAPTHYGCALKAMQTSGKAEPSAQAEPVAYPSDAQVYAWWDDARQKYADWTQRVYVVTHKAIDWYRAQPQPAQAQRDGVMEALSAIDYLEIALKRGYSVNTLEKCFATLREQVQSLTDAKGEG